MIAPTSAGLRRVVVTGGPGAGKTTLLAELSARGHATVEESARSVIVARRAAGLPPRPAPAEFAREILRQDTEKHRHPPRRHGLVFYDRCAVEALGMVHDAAPFEAADLERQLMAFAFERTVFMLPPWPEIYVNDAERDHPFDHAVRVHAHLLDWYLRCGYDVHPVPRVSVAARADHVLSVLRNGD